jgi:hypothetical protein
MKYLGVIIFSVLLASCTTIDVYEKSDQIISENNPTNPETLYGFSKLYCEKMIENWANANNKIVQILRLGHVYGPGEGLFKKIIPVTMQKIKANEHKLFSLLMLFLVSCSFNIFVGFSTCKCQASLGLLTKQEFTEYPKRTSRQKKTLI